MLQTIHNHSYKTKLLLTQQSTTGNTLPHTHTHTHTGTHASFQVFHHTPIITHYNTLQLSKLVPAMFIQKVLTQMAKPISEFQLSNHIAK